MTVKELKEQINKDSSKISKIELSRVMPANALQTLNENLEVEKILEDKYLLTQQAKQYLKELHEQYSFIKEIENFIDFVLKRYSNIMLDYKLIDENTSEIKYQYIAKNKLKEGSIQYQKGDISILCYTRYINQILHYIRVELKEEEKNEQK